MLNGVTAGGWKAAVIVEQLRSEKDNKARVILLSDSY
jgi:hypothetical protein